jgi:hypothetical protein
MTEDSTVVCWDLDLRVVDKFSISEKVDSLAMTRDDEIWMLPFGSAGPGLTLLQWQKGRGGWARTRRLTGNTSDRTMIIAPYEVRAVDDKTVVVVPLMGGYEANRITYPAPSVWSTESGPSARLTPRTVTVDRDIQDNLKRLHGLPLRLVFTSTASRSHVAIIPALLQPDDRPPRHDEVWWRDLKQGAWRVSKLPGPVGAIALGERDVFAATEDGRIWRHTISP